jgi:hypothetical protein
VSHDQNFVEVSLKFLGVSVALDSLGEPLSPQAELELLLTLPD